MKNFTYLLLMVIIAGILLCIHVNAQIAIPVFQNPTYPCDTLKDPGGSQCIHVCAGDTVKYSTPLQGAFIKWDLFGDGTILSGQGTSEITVVWNSPGQYTVLLTVCQSSSGTDCKSYHLCVIVEPGVTALIGFDPSYTIENGCIKICNNTAVTFNSSGSNANIIGCDWDFGDGFSTTTTSSVVTHTYTVPGTYTVTLTAHSACCSDTAQFCVTVDSLSGPDIFCISPVCGGTEEVEYCTNATCANYSWTVNGGVISGSSNSNCVTIDWGAGPVGTVSLLATNCTPATCPVPTIATVPIMPNGTFTIGGPIIACVFPPNVYTYSAPYIPGAQYTWTLTDPSSNTTTLPYSTPPYLQNISFPVTGTYVLKCHMVNDVLDCEGDGILTINVLGDFTIAGDDTVCVNGTGNFSALQNFNPFNVDWTTTPSVGTVLNSSTASFIFTSPGTYTVTATPLPGTACSPFKTLTVVVLLAPPQATISANPLVCPGTPYTYTASGSGSGVIYSWTATGGITFNDPNANPVTANIPNVFSGGTITVTPVNSAGCPGTPTTINVNPYATPTPVISIGDASVCPDETPTYTATLSYAPTSTVVWSLSPAALGTIQSGQGTASVVIEWHASIPNVLQTCTVKVEETICGNLTGSNTFVVTINPTPTPSAPDKNICIGGTTTLTVTGGGGSTFNWFTSSGSSVGSGNSVSVSSPGNYYVEETDVNGCKGKDFLQVIAYPQPIVGISASAPASCDTNGNMISNIQLQTFAGSGYTFSWSGPAIVGSTTANPITISATGLYSVTVTAPVNGCTNSASYAVICATADTCELPVCSCAVGTPSVTQNGPYCDDYTFTTNSACPFITWSFGDGQFGSGSSVSHQYSAPGVYFVYYSAGDVNCCPNISSYLTITVPAVANFTPVITCNTVCFTDASAALPSDPIDPSGYSWDFGDSQTSTQISPCHTYGNSGTYTVTLEITTNSGCKAKISKLVTVNGPNVTASIAATACNQPVNFTGSTTSTNIVSWMWDFGDSQGSNSQNAQHIYSVLVTTTFTVTLIVTDANGCTDTATGTITVTPPPPPFNFIYTSPGCGNVLLDAGAGYNSYQWFLNGTAISGATNQTHTAVTTGNYYVEVVDVNGCMIQSNQASIIVNPLPALNVTASPQPLCSNQAITLSSGVSGNYLVEWKDGSNNLITTGLTYSPGILLTGSYTFNVVATDLATSCKDSTSITIVVNQAPTVTISNSNPSGICAPNPVTLTATGNPVSVTYLWSNNAITPAITVYSGGTYTVTVTDPANGCMASAFSNVIIFPLPDLSMLPIGCDSGCINPVADTIHGPPGMNIYDWQINGVSVSNLQDLDLNNINLPNYGVPYTITLIATTIHGCVDSTTFEYTPKNCDTVHCYSITDTIWCNTDGTYSVQLMVNNQNAQQTASIMINNFTSPFMVNGMSYYYQFLNVPPNSSSGWFPSTPLVLSLPPSSTVPASFCFTSLIIYPDTCCWDSLCIAIPNCVPCDNIGISSTDDDSSCCKTVSLVNNYNGGYFTGIQVTPITVGASIGSTYLGGPYVGSWNSPVNNSSTVIYQPNSGFIPTGNINGLFTMCLSLAPGTPSPQIVVLNWLVANSNGEDSVACSDTLKFFCEAEPLNPCGTVEDTIICLGDGNYQYSFTLTNLSPNYINMAAVDYMNPTGMLNNFPLVFFYPPLAPGGSYTQTFTFSTSLPAGSTICYHITLLDSIGCCCHAVDTICFTLPECDTLCDCGEWNDLFTIHVSPPPAGFPDEFNIECGATLQDLQAGATITFTTPMYYCSGDSACTANLMWNIPGASSSSGTGLPTFTMNSAGNYTLTIYAFCGGDICDSCTISFMVNENCECGHWDTFLSDITTSGSSTSGHIMECGATFDQVATGTIYSFTSGSYLCSGVDTCSSSITWSLPGATPSSGTGLPSFALNSPGTFTLTMYGYCGGHLCDSCTITFNVVEECTCGSWQPFSVTTSFTSYINQPCGGFYYSKKGVPITLNGSYDCIGGDSCSASYSWILYKNSMFSASGTSLPITFTPGSAGTYVVVISALCDGQDCETCTFTFKVKKPQEEFGVQQQNFEANSGNIQLKAVPNPAYEVVTLHLSSEQPESGLIVWFNEMGIAVKQTQIQWKRGELQLEMNVADLPAGSYLVRFLGEGSSVFEKVIVYR